jgi:hypothetical protein
MSLVGQGSLQVKSFKMKTSSQFRSVGPVTLADCSAEEVVRLSEAVSNEGTKIKYVILVHGKREGGGEDGHLKRSVTFCAQAFEKLSPTMWMRQLGMLDSRGGPEHKAFQESLVPAANLLEDIQGMRADKGCAEYGKAPPVSASDRRLAQKNGFWGNTSGGGGAVVESEGVETSDEVNAGGGDTKPRPGKKTKKTVPPIQVPDAQAVQVTEEAQTQMDAQLEVPVDSADEMPVELERNQSIGASVKVECLLNPEPSFEDKVRQHLTRQLHCTSQHAKGEDGTPLSQLGVEEVWAALYAESLAWCKEQAPSDHGLWELPSKDHDAYVAMAMRSHPLATEEWRVYAGNRCV